MHPSYITENGEVNYLLYIPEDYSAESQKKWPLLIILRGRSRVYSDVIALGDDYPLNTLAEDGLFLFVVLAPKSKIDPNIGADYDLWDRASGELALSMTPGSPLTSLAYSPDGERLAVGGADGKVYLLDSGSALVEMTLSAHQALVGAVNFSAEGDRLVSVGWDGLAKVWDLASASEIVTFSAHGDSFPGDPLLFGAAFSPDGEQVFTAGEFHARLWDAATGQEIRTYSGEGREVYGMALSPSGKLLALGLQDGEVVVFDTNNGQKILQLSGHTGLTLRLVFSQDEMRLASASFDGYAKIWDLETGQELFTLYGNNSNVFGVALSLDGDHLATTGGDGTLRIFSMQMEELIALAESRVSRALTQAECQKYLHEKCP